MADYREETDEIRAIQDEIIRLKTRVDGLDDKHDDLRAEFKAEIMVLQRKIEGLQENIRLGFVAMQEDNRRTRSWQTWLIGGLTTGGSAAGAAIWHAIMAGVK